jgi:hypothetical protein
MNQGMRGLFHAVLIPMRREDVHVMIWMRGVFLFCCSTSKVFFHFCIRNGLLVTTVQPSYTVTLTPYGMTHTHMHTYIHACIHTCIQICRYAYRIMCIIYVCVYIYIHT